METLPLRAQDPRCDILGEHPPAHSGRTPQALASTQEEETAWQHRTRARGMERQAPPSHQEALRPPPQHFSRRSKFHSERFGAEPMCATQCWRIPFQACTQQAIDTCTALHRNYGLAWAWARRQGPSKRISGSTQTQTPSFACGLLYQTQAPAARPEPGAFPLHILHPVSLSHRSICSLQYLIPEGRRCTFGYFLLSVRNDRLLSERKYSRN